MSTPIRVLIVEDSEDDTVLVLRELRRGGYDPTYERVDTDKAMRDALDNRTWDIIICDYSMPKFSMPVALETLQEMGLDLPFILVSGTVGEEIAVKAMKAGAHDYIMKDRLARLVPAIERELREAKKRHRIKEVEGRVRKLSQAVEQSPSTVVITDINGKIEYVNPKFTDITGYTGEEAIGRNPHFLKSGKHTQEFYKELWDTITSGNEWHREVCNRKKNGELYWESISISPIKNHEGVITDFVKVAEDITERKRVEQERLHFEEQIMKSLKEKEVLLKEVHHRVKNNLQVISSLLNLQSKHIKDKKALNVFRESQNRVKSMALAHEELYQSKDMARIDFKEYVRNLINYLFRSYGVNSDIIMARIKIKDIFLDVDMAIPCGLIINELVSNSLKHAFPAAYAACAAEKPGGNVYEEPGRAEGEISINFYSDNNKHALIVSDNGVSFPEDIDFRKTKSLGLQLVSTLTHQLGGVIRLDESRGTEFTITFEK